jgi:hypothetical protein
MSKLKTVDQWIEFAKENKYPWAEKFAENVKIYVERVNRELENWTKEYPRAETVKKRVTRVAHLKTAVLTEQGHWEETPEGFEFWCAVYDSIIVDNVEGELKRPEDMYVAVVLTRAMAEKHDWALAAYNNFLTECTQDPDHSHATLKRTHSVEEINRNPYKCALHVAFAWDKTPQGAEYWIRITEELEFEN